MDFSHNHTLIFRLAAFWIVTSEHEVRALGYIVAIERNLLCASANYFAGHNRNWRDMRKGTHSGVEIKSFHRVDFLSYFRS